MCVCARDRRLYNYEIDDFLQPVESIVEAQAEMLDGRDLVTAHREVVQRLELLVDQLTLGLKVAKKLFRNAT